MSSETRHFESKEFETQRERIFSPRIEATHLLHESSKPHRQIFGTHKRSREEVRFASFGIQKTNGDILRGAGRTFQVLTVAALELLASATAVVAGSVVAGGALHFPYTILVLGAPIVPGLILPVTLSVVGIGLIIIGMNRIGVATKRVRSLFFKTHN